MKRINLKSKRLRNLIKKAIELSQMCDIDISLVMMDREMNKVTQYCSGSQEDGLFTAEDAQRAIERQKEIEKAIKVYTDSDYKILKTKEKSEDKRRRPRPIETPKPLPQCNVENLDVPLSLPYKMPKLEQLQPTAPQSLSMESSKFDR